MLSVILSVVYVTSILACIYRTHRSSWSYDYLITGIFGRDVLESSAYSSLPAFFLFGRSVALMGGVVEGRAMVALFVSGTVHLLLMVATTSISSPEMRGVLNVVDNIASCSVGLSVFVLAGNLLVDDSDDHSR
jgi:Fe2+ transport system protein B